MQRQDYTGSSNYTGGDGAKGYSVNCAWQGQGYGDREYLYMMDQVSPSVRQSVRQSVSPSVRQSVSQSHVVHAFIFLICITVLYLTRHSFMNPT